MDAQDCFNVEGEASTIGITSFIKNGPVKSNSPLVQILVNLGAVLYVKTNIPQTMMVSLLASFSWITLTLIGCRFS